jgi:hypothetical protein
MVARPLTMTLILLMLTQALLGLAIPMAYRDVEWIKATWYGNDWVTLAVAVPLLLVGLREATRDSLRGVLLWLGGTAYALYNYAFYLFGAALNAYFLIYVAAFVLAVIVLILNLAALDTGRVAKAVRPSAPSRLLAASLVFIGVGLAVVWIAMWAAYVFAGRPTPVEPEAFKLVAALDLSLMVPALTVGGFLLWRRTGWGYVISTIASIQGALYLLVLTVNAVVAIRRGIVSAPGELPIWAPLTVIMAAAAFALLANVRHEPSLTRQA